MLAKLQFLPPRKNHSEVKKKTILWLGLAMKRSAVIQVVPAVEAEGKSVSEVAVEVARGIVAVVIATEDVELGTRRRRNMDHCHSW